jgi:hypothetical protein
MKKLFYLLVIALSLGACSVDEAYETPSTANMNVSFNIITDADTRAASVGDSWPTTDSKTQAETVVNNVYTTPKNNGISFFTTNYKVLLTNDKGGTINDWKGSTEISLTEVNNITVQLTPITEGKFPKFNTVIGTLDLSEVELDKTTPDINDVVSTGGIKVTKITCASDKINVTIQVDLAYDSYLLIAPSSDFSVLSTDKGFKSIQWGQTNGNAFYDTTVNGNKWFYYWGNGDGYVYGKGNILSYGFNFTTTNDGTKIIVEKGKWYGLFASWNSVGETAFIGEDGNIIPTANEVVCGGAIR